MAEATATEAPTTPAASKLIIENIDVQEFFKLLRDNNSPSINEMIDIVRQMSAMEKYMEAATNQIATMQLQLAEMEAKNHPVQTALSNAIVTTQAQVSNIQDKLTELKNNFIAGCKNTVDAFKEKGIAALNNVAQFFNIKPSLDNLCNELNKGIQQDNKTIAKIETISTEYHETGLHLKNIGRAILGKELLQEAKPNGNLSKALTAPYRADRKCLSAMKNCAEKAISSLSRLEERAAKPSITGTIQKYADQIEKQQAKKEAPTMEKPVTHAER